jgi:prolyl-tRNA synthetase
MRWSQTLIPTMKETPEGAEIPSHILMVRSGMIAQVMAGAYTYLPLGHRALRKASEIVRQEMDQAGAVEMQMSALSPISLWEQTGRVEAFGDVLVKVTLPRGNRKVQLVLCPTHEEIITELISRFISSYRQLPVTLYQIQTKFRNEERPRFGVLRTSEFLMKDAYSFDPSIESLNKNYDRMYHAYCRIFDRCGIPYLPVEAESGPIGGDASHEFMIPAENGEDTVVHCKACGYAANTEKAEIGGVTDEAEPADAVEIEEIATPEMHTVEQVCRFLKCPPAQLIKTLIYLVDDKPTAVLVRGDHEANENKIRRAFDAQNVALAEPEVIEQVTGAPVGFAGPVGLKKKIPIWADHGVRNVRNAVTGANRADTHLKGVNRDRDFQVDQFGDLRDAVQGDPCPRCNGTLMVDHAIEVGHVFKLGTKYSEALSAKFLDTDESQKTILMGCYGIGVNRILAGLIETSHDDSGIVWPVALAPYEVVIAPLKINDEETMAVADKMHRDLTDAGIDVMLDDRDQRPGVKFKDADLIGFPLRIVLGPRGLKEGKVEVKWRWESEPEMLELPTATEKIIDMLNDERTSGTRFRQGRQS